MAVSYSRVHDGERQEERPADEPRRGRDPGEWLADAAFAPLIGMQRLIARDGAVAWYGRLLSHPVRTYQEDAGRRQQRRAGRSPR